MFRDERRVEFPTNFELSFHCIFRIARRTAYSHSAIIRHCEYYEWKVRSRSRNFDIFVFVECSNRTVTCYEACAFVSLEIIKVYTVDFVTGVVVMSTIQTRRHDAKRRRVRIYLINIIIRWSKQYVSTLYVLYVSHCLFLSYSLAFRRVPNGKPAIKTNEYENIEHVQILRIKKKKEEKNGKRDVERE